MAADERIKTTDEATSCRICRPMEILIPDQEEENDDDADDSWPEDEDLDSTFRHADPGRVAQAIVRRVGENDPDCLLLELEDGYMTEWLEIDVQDHVHQLLQALQRNTTLQHVSVSGEFFSALESSDHGNDSDTMMNWRSSSFDALFFDRIGQLPVLTTLEIQQVIDSFDGYSLSIDSLHCLVRRAIHLERLTLRFVELCRSTATVESQGEYTLDASLASMGVTNENNSANRRLYRAFHKHPSLQQVCFSQLRLEEGITLNSLIRGLASIPNLHTVQVHLGVQRQRHLRMAQEQAGVGEHPGYVQGILKPLGMSSTLEALELSSLCLEDEQSMLEAMHHSPALKDLFLGHCELTFSGWAMLARMLKRQVPDQCVALESLRLDSMAGLDDDTIQLLCHALTTSKPPQTGPTLRTLRLYNVMDMGCRGWKAIADMLASNATLRILSMENCQGMDDDAVLGIALSLESNSTLSTLELQVFSGHCTTFTQEVGQQALLDVLEAGKNITLETLYTQASGKLEKKIEFYLGLNRTCLREYVLGKYSKTSGSVAIQFYSRLEAYINDLDVVFYVLSTNPSFVLSCLMAL